MPGGLRGLGAHRAGVRRRRVTCLDARQGGAATPTRLRIFRGAQHGARESAAFSATKEQTSLVALDIDPDVLDARSGAGEDVCGERTADGRRAVPVEDVEGGAIAKDAVMGTSAFSR